MHLVRANKFKKFKDHVVKQVTAPQGHSQGRILTLSYQDGEHLKIEIVLRLCVSKLKLIKL